MFVPENINILRKIVAKVQVQMKDIMQRIDRITSTIKIISSTERVSNYLRLKSIDDIKDIETQQEQDFLQEYVSKK